MVSHNRKLYKGHCQKCGGEYLLVDGLILVHEFHLTGWLEGFCSGSSAAPMEKRHGITDFTVADVLQNCEGLRELIGFYRNGDDHPRRIALPANLPVSGKTYLRWEELSDKSKEDVLCIEIARLQKLVDDGEQFARRLKTLAASVHGLPLIAADVGEILTA